MDREWVRRAERKKIEERTSARPTVLATYTGQEASEGVAQVSKERDPEQLAQWKRNDHNAIQAHIFQLLSRTYCFSMDAMHCEQ